MQRENTPATPSMIAFRVDPENGVQEIGLEEFVRFTPTDATSGFVWQHLERDHPETTRWLEAAGLDSFVIEALTAVTPRPRCTVHDEGVILVLNALEGGGDQGDEELASVRLWIEPSRVVGVWVRDIGPIGDLINAIRRGQAPDSAGTLVARIALRTVGLAELPVEQLDEVIDDLEQQVLDDEGELPHAELNSLRKTAIKLHRQIVLQRDALVRLEIEDLDWFSDADQSRLREAGDRAVRLVEDLDSIRSRAQVVHDRIMERRSDALNQRMLVLSIVAAIFLPLGLLTGLLGINVGGIPGAKDPMAFWIVCGMLVSIGGGLLLWFWRSGTMR